MFSNNFKYLLLTKEVDLSADVFKAIVMQYGFEFDPATHEDYGDISSSELATGNGYTAGGITLTNVTITTDSINNEVIVTFDNVGITASGGDLGPLGGVVIIDDSITDNPIVAFIDYGESYIIADGGTGTLANIKITL